MAKKLVILKILQFKEVTKAKLEMANIELFWKIRETSIKEIRRIKLEMAENWVKHYVGGSFA